MVTSSQHSIPSLIGEATSKRRVEMDKDMVNDESFSNKGSSKSKIPDVDLSFGERAFSAAGAAVISAIVVNPLDVVKTRLQAQAARTPYEDLHQAACFESSTMLKDAKFMPSSFRASGAQPTCSPDCTHYGGTWDVFYKVIRQEGFSRLWRGTNASLALAIPSVGIYMPLYDIFRNHMEEVTSQNVPSLRPYVPLVAGSLARSIACVTCYPIELARTRMQAFGHSQVDVKPPGVLKTLISVVSPAKSGHNQSIQNYRMLWTGLGAQLARDVPFSAVCWASLEALRRRILSTIGEEASASSILGANFCAGFVSGSLAAAATCPLDVARTRQQIEKDPTRALTMTTRHTLAEIWRDRGIKGLFTGAGPRVGRAGPSVGIVVSCYEVVKYGINCAHS